ncbi:uncharacterized protein LOC143190001 isoform X2 [Rhynchophorus ferrugineus]|uniref:uncharacterized protein LOC143190001 isoform X2 n=1 Tax=Rhynchophorus ferrugineus TaxID=354439 RepID=UPI003FCD03FA
MAEPPPYGFTWYPPPPTLEPPQCICNDNPYVTRQQCPKCINAPNGTVHWITPTRPPDIGNPSPPDTSVHFSGHHNYYPRPYVVPKPLNTPSPCGLKPYYWVDSHSSYGVPSTALRGGHDIDGAEIFVGRAFHEGDWLPAKVIPDKRIAYVAYGGSEHMKHEYQILCEQRFDWVPSIDGAIPPGAVEGGRTSDGEPLYIGRVHHDGAITVGKVHSSHGVCYIPFDGKEMPHHVYEVLVLRS